MTQDEAWTLKYQEVVAFIETNKRNPSEHSDEERGKYLNWLKHNKKVFAAGEMKPDRAAGIRIKGTVSFIHSLSTNKHNIFPQESLSKCSLN